MELDFSTVGRDFGPYKKLFGAFGGRMAMISWEDGFGHEVSEDVELGSAYTSYVEVQFQREEDELDEATGDRLAIYYSDVRGLHIY